MSSYNTRRSGGKRIRMEEEEPQNDYDSSMDASSGGGGGYQQGGAGGGGGYEAATDYGGFACTSNESYDPTAYYRQQQQEMLLQATQHVQASQEEIQQAQHIAQMQETAQRGGGEEEEDMGIGGRRRSRAAATQAKQALSMMNESSEQMDQVVFDRPAISPYSGRGRRGRGGGGDGGRGGRSRPPGTTAAVITARRLAKGGGGGGGGGYAAGGSDYERRKPGRQVRTTDILPEDESSLYYIIRNGKASLQQVVDEWIDSYKADREDALLSLMQFFISASGCKGRITADMQAPMEHANIIRTMTEEFDEESGEYPLVTAGQFWKKFRQNFCEFIQLLVKQCQYSIIYDQHLMDNVISLLTQLSDSQVRAFRHTATLAAMKLMTALVDVALTVSINLENTQRQYDAEQQNNRSSERLETLMTRRKELEENTDEIKNMLTYMFKSVFVHRYRDILPEIRSICMFEIGQWMKKYHTNFLDDTYLKYIGWTIHDKVGDVRLKCLQTLQPLYASEELKGKLELFTSKFKDRIVQMTLDKDFDVAVEAVMLVISIHRYHRDILSDKDCESLYELVYSSHRAVAQAAGEFLNERLFIPEDEDLRTKRGKKRLPNTPLIRDLVQFFIESELHEQAAYLVDSLIESNPMMKDWECMTDLLLEEPGPKEEALEDKQEASLIEVMVCCIKQAATGEPPVGRGPTRKVLSAKELKQKQDDKQSLTAHFIQTLPPLLRKYLPDAEKVANLLVIPQYFDLEIYTTSRQERNLDAMLSLIQEIVDKHSDKNVLETCAITLDRLCNDQHAIFSRCDVARSRLLDMVSNNYKEAIDEYMNLLHGKEEPNDDEMFKLISSFKTVEAFSNCHNMSAWGVWESMFDVVQKFKESRDEMKLPTEAVKSALAACYFGLMWDQHQIENTTERNSTADDVMTLRSRLERYMEIMKDMLLTCPEVSLKEEAFLSITDLLLFFKRTESNRNVLAPLVYRPNSSLHHMMNKFIQQHVFIDQDESQDDHTKIEELHKRRNLLTAFCKLIVYNVFPTKLAADVFKHYVIFYNDYGDIIKTTLGKARENNKVNWAKTMVHSLILKFKEVQQLQGAAQIDRQTVEFHSLKDLAKRFALSFGLDALKNRDAVAQLHQEGILFSMTPLENPNDPTGPPPNLAFLEIATEFTNKLLKQDKKVVLGYLDKRISAAMPSSHGEDWQPLHLYRNSLVHGEGEVPTVTSKRPYARKRKAMEDDNDDGSDEDY